MPSPITVNEANTADYVKFWVGLWHNFSAGHASWILHAVNSRPRASHKISPYVHSAVASAILMSCWRI